MLPEYARAIAAKNPEGAALVHEESSYVAKLAVATALAGHKDVVFDGTGDSSIDKLTSKVAEFRAAGAHKIVANYVTIPTATAIARSEARAAKTGRVVPTAVLAATHASVSRVYPLAVARGLFNRTTLYENSGRTPKLIATSRGTRLRVRNPKLYADFIAKGAS